MCVLRLVPNLIRLAYNTTLIPDQVSFFCFDFMAQMVLRQEGDRYILFFVFFFLPQNFLMHHFLVDYRPSLLALWNTNSLLLTTQRRFDNNVSDDHFAKNKQMPKFPVCYCLLSECAVLCASISSRVDMKTPFSRSQVSQSSLLKNKPTPYFFLPKIVTVSKIIHTQQSKQSN